MITAAPERLRRDDSCLHLHDWGSNVSCGYVMLHDSSSMMASEWHSVLPLVVFNSYQEFSEYR